MTKAKRPHTDPTLKLPSDSSGTVNAPLNTPPPPPAAEIAHVGAKTALAWSKAAAERSRKSREAGDALRTRVRAMLKGKGRAFAALARALAHAVKNGGHRAAGGETRVEGAVVRRDHALSVDVNDDPILRCPDCGARLIVMRRDRTNTRLVSYHCRTHGPFLLDSERRLLKNG